MEIYVLVCDMQIWLMGSQSFLLAIKICSNHINIHLQYKHIQRFVKPEYHTLYVCNVMNIQQMDLSIQRNKYMIDANIGLVYFLCFANCKAFQLTRLQLSEYYQISKQYFKNKNSFKVQIFTIKFKQDIICIFVKMANIILYRQQIHTVKGKDLPDL